MADDKLPDDPMYDGVPIHDLQKMWTRERLNQWAKKFMDTHPNTFVVVKGENDITVHGELTYQHGPCNTHFTENCPKCLLEPCYICQGLGAFHKSICSRGGYGTIERRCHVCEGLLEQYQNPRTRVWEVIWIHTDTKVIEGMCHD